MARVETLALVLLQAVAAVAAWRVWQMHTDKQHKLLQALKHELDKKEKMRLDERKGRVAAEKELRRVMDDKLDTSKGYFVQSIGEIHSCFQSCLGTPRQGLLAPSTKGRIEFQRSISPDTLIGLEAFSHVWIIFVFHKNTNGKNARAHEGLRSDSHRHTFRAKISPPLLKERVGIFSTRSPHRPNPVGITLAKIDSIDMRKRTVFISGVDLVEGTPVLDIKPYVPGYDYLPDAHAAAWVTSAQLPTEVHWRTSSSVVYQLANSSAHYRGIPDTFTRAIEEVLQVDVRSKDQTKRWADANAVSEIVIDNARVEYCVVLPDTANTSVTAVSDNTELSAGVNSGHAVRETAQPMRVFITAVTQAELSAKDMAASVAPNLPQPSARVVTVSAEQSAPSMPEMPAPAAPEHDQQQHSRAVDATNATLYVAGSVGVDPTAAPMLAKGTSKASSKKKAKTKAKAGGGSKKKKLVGPPCVGLYVDALDTKMLWSEAQIIECKLDEQKIKVHFIGWHARWDIWTDAMNVAAHGTYVPLKKKSLENPRRWDGKTNLFSETVPEPNGDEELFEPLVKDSPEKHKATKPSHASTESHHPPPTLLLSTPSTQPTSAAPSSRKARPPKLAIDKAPSKPAAAVATTIKKKSPSSKSKSSDQVTLSGDEAVAKTPPVPSNGTVPTVSGKKRKSSVSGNTFSKAPTKRLKETAELEPADGVAPVDFAGARRQNMAENEQTAGFLQRCAALWQRQLSLLLTRPSERTPGSKLKA